MDPIKDLYSAIKSTGLFLDENDLRAQLAKAPKDVFSVVSGTKLFVDYNDFETQLGLKKKEPSSSGGWSSLFTEQSPASSPSASASGAGELSDAFNKLSSSPQLKAVMGVAGIPSSVVDKAKTVTESKPANTVFEMSTQRPLKRSEQYDIGVERMQNFTAEEKDLASVFRYKPEEFKSFAKEKLNVDYDEYAKRYAADGTQIADREFVWKAFQKYKDLRTSAVLESSRQTRPKIDNELQSRLDKISELLGQPLKMPTNEEEVAGFLSLINSAKSVSKPSALSYTPRSAMAMEFSPSSTNQNYESDKASYDKSQEVSKLWDEAYPYFRMKVGQIVLDNLSKKNPNINSHDLGKEMLRVLDGKTYKQYKLAKGDEPVYWFGTNVSETPTEADDINRNIQSMGAEVMRLYGNRFAIEKADFDEKQLDSKFLEPVKERIKHKIAAGLSNRASLTESSDAAMSAVESSVLTNKERELWEQMKKDNDTKLPSTGLVYSFLDGLKETASDALTTITSGANANIDRERMLKNFEGQYKSSLLGENPEMKAEFDMLKKKKDEGTLTSEDESRMRELSQFVNLRSSGQKIVDMIGSGAGQLAVLLSLQRLTGGLGGSTVAAGLMSYESNARQAVAMFPDDPGRADLTTMAFNAFSILSERIFPEHKVVENAMRDVFMKRISGMTTEAIAKQLKGSLIKDLAKAAIGVGKATLKPMTQETAESVIEQGLQDAFTGVVKPEELNGRQLSDYVDNGIQSFWGSAAFGAVGGVSKLKLPSAPIKSLWRASTSPIAYLNNLRLIDRLEESGDLTAKEADERRKIMTMARSEARENPVLNGQVGNMSVSNKQNYMARLINEKLMEEKMAGTTDENAKEELQRQIDLSKDIRKKMYNGEIKATPDNQEVAPVGKNVEISLADKEFRDNLPESGLSSADDIQSGEYAIVTASNENMEGEANDELNQNAKAWLEERGLTAVPVLGVFNGKASRSFFVQGMNRKQAVEFAREFDQNSVAHSTGLVNQDGSFNPTKGVRVSNNPGNNFTSINIGGKVVDVEFDFDKNTVESAASAFKKEVLGSADQAVDNVRKSLASTGVTVDMVDDTKAFDDEAARVGQNGAEGMFLSKEGRIVINRQKLRAAMGDNRVVWHEASHPVMNIVRNTNRQLYEKVLDGMKKADDAGVRAVMGWAQKNYGAQGQDVVDDESIVETIANIADGRIDVGSIPTGLRQSLIDLINSISKALGFGQILNDTDVAAFKKMALNVADALRSGRDVSEIVGKENVSNYQNQLAQLRKDSAQIAKQTEDRTVEGSAQPSMILVGKKKGADIELYSGPASIQAIRDVKPDMYVSRAEELAKSNLVQGKVRMYPSTASTESKLKWADNVYAKAKETVISNLLYIYDKIPQEIRDISKLWYDGANVIAQEMSSKYGFSLEQTSAVIASQSPQKPWYDNVHLAHFVIDFYTNNMDTKFTHEMYDYFELKSRPTKNNPAGYPKQIQYLTTLKEAIGKRFSELSNYDKSVMIRAEFDNKYERRAPLRIPTGVIVGRVSSMSSFSGYDTIAKAVSILSDGSGQNISKNLGSAFKVRNFNNNIVNPKMDGEVTIDTHAMAAAYMLPLGSSSPEVKFDEATYSFFADAYRDAAKQRGVLAREMQSIVWEGVRSVFPATDKSSKNKDNARAIWSDFKSGAVTLSEVQNKIKENGKDLSVTDWSRFIDRILEEDEQSSHLEELSLAGGDQSSLGLGDGGSDSGGLPGVGEGGVRTGEEGGGISQASRGNRVGGWLAANVDKYSEEDLVDVLMDNLGVSEGEARKMVADARTQKTGGVEELQTYDTEPGREKTRAFAKDKKDGEGNVVPSRIGSLEPEVFNRIEQEAKTYFAQPNRSTEAAAIKFMEGKSLEEMADYVVSEGTNIAEPVRIWIAAETANRLGQEMRQAKADGDLVKAERLAALQANIFNEFAKRATELGQAVQSFVAFKKNPDAINFYLNKILRDLGKKGVNNLTDEQKQQIKDMLGEVSNADAGLPKNIAITKLQHYLAGLAPVSPMDLLSAIWYAHILSGPTTQTKNFFANLGMLLVEVPMSALFHSIKNMNPMPLFYALKGVAGGVVKGSVKAADILRSGIVEKQDGKYFDNRNVLEYYSWDRAFGKAGKAVDWNPLFGGVKWLRLVGRALTAADALFSTTSQEAMVNMLAYDRARQMGRDGLTNNVWRTTQDLLGNNKQVIEEATRKAQSEGLKGLAKKRRVIELVNESRNEQDMADAERFGQRVTLTNEPEGFTRPLYWLASQVQTLPGGRVFVPFTRVIANLTELMVSYTPAGLYRAATGVRTFDYKSTKFKPGPENKLSDEERGELLMKAVLGTATFIILRGKMGTGEDDWFDITAGGPRNFQKKYELMKEGWRPYTITFPNGKKLNYQDLPIAGWLASLGTVRDAENYEDADVNMIEAAASGYMLALYDKSVMKGVSDFVSIFKPDGRYGDNTSIVDRAKKFFAQQVGSVVMSNFQRQVMRFVMESQDDPIKMAKGFEMIYRDMPVINDGLRPIVDVFGDPVTPSTSERLIPYFSVSDEKKDALLKYLHEHKAFVGVTPDKPIIEERGDLYVERPMTDEEKYYYKLAAGKITKKLLYDRFEMIKDAVSEIEASFEEEKKKADEADEETKKLFQSKMELEKRATVRSLVNKITSAARKLAMVYVTGAMDAEEMKEYDLTSFSSK